VRLSCYQSRTQKSCNLFLGIGISVYIFYFSIYITFSIFFLCSSKYVFYVSSSLPYQYDYCILGKQSQITPVKNKYFFLSAFQIPSTRIFYRDKEFCVSIRWRFGVYLVSIWCPFGVHLVSIWCPFGVHLVSIWCPFGVHLVSFRCPFGVR